MNRTPLQLALLIQNTYGESVVNIHEEGNTVCIDTINGNRYVITREQQEYDDERVG